MTFQSAAGNGIPFITADVRQREPLLISGWVWSGSAKTTEKISLTARKSRRTFNQSAAAYARAQTSPMERGTEDDTDGWFSGSGILGQDHRPALLQSSTPIYSSTLPSDLEPFLAELAPDAFDVIQTGGLDDQFNFGLVDGYSAEAAALANLQDVGAEVGDSLTQPG